jgi:hypothetical protein
MPLGLKYRYGIPTPDHALSECLRGPAVPSLGAVRRSPVDLRSSDRRSNPDRRSRSMGNFTRRRSPIIWPTHRRSRSTRRCCSRRSSVPRAVMKPNNLRRAPRAERARERRIKANVTECNPVSVRGPLTTSRHRVLQLVPALPRKRSTRSRSQAAGRLLRSTNRARSRRRRSGQ